MIFSDKHAKHLNKGTSCFGHQNIMNQERRKLLPRDMHCMLIFQTKQHRVKKHNIKFSLLVFSFA